MTNIAPTKTNLLKLSDELKFARLGHELLDQKRNILVVELLSLLDQAVEHEATLEASLARAYATLEDAVLAMGKLRVSSLACAVNVESRIKFGRRRVMGVELPVVETRFEEHPPFYGPAGASHRMDEAVREFRGVLKLMGRFAELKVSIVRLAAEVRKTIRKVNALEKVAIPDLTESLRHVRNRLEENERDMFVLMKMVKNRLTAGERGSVER